MPELPEVETVRRGLAPVPAGATIVAVEQNRPDLRFPLPARFANSVDSRPGTIATPPGQQEYAASMRSSYTSRHGHNVDEDVDMEDDDDYYERQQRSRGRSDEDDEGMFGRMEE